jgi:aspartate aminotransferase
MNFQSGLSKSAFVPARRMEGVSESATLRLNALVQKMRAEGEDVVNLTTGEPDFDVPEAAKEAAIDAIKKNRSKYTPRQHKLW